MYADRSNVEHHEDAVQVVHFGKQYAEAANAAMSGATTNVRSCRRITAPESKSMHLGIHEEAHVLDVKGTVSWYSYSDSYRLTDDRSSAGKSECNYQQRRWSHSFADETSGHW